VQQAENNDGVYNAAVIDWPMRARIPSWPGADKLPTGSVVKLVEK
jgi:hypothetical protein